MSRRAYLVLEDGAVFEGWSFGAERDSYGELVFSTSMTGYQEALTDPSFAGQLVTLTYPLIGNYGINDEDNESVKVQVAGFVVREHCLTPSNGTNASTLHEFLAAQDVPGIFGVDTRAVTRRLRNRGVMMGVIALDSPSRAERLWGLTPRYDDVDHVARVTTPEVYRWEGRMGERATGRSPLRGVDGERGLRIVVTDYGVKNNVLRCLHERGCEVVTAPADVSASEVLALKPDGLLLSPGPGDPALLDYAVDAASELLGRVPTLGICLGHQVVARALGGGNVQAALRSPGGESSREGSGDGPGVHHGSEPRVRGGRGDAAEGVDGESREFERRNDRGACASGYADNDDTVSFGGVAGAAGQRVYF